MSYFGVGLRESWNRYVVPPAVAVWRRARDLVLMRRRRDAARTDRVAKAADRSRHMASWQRSHDE